jgi:hypothetical protein
MAVHISLSQASHMTFPGYFADTVERMVVESRSIRRDFAAHRGIAGAHREEVVRKFLGDHLPTRFAVDTGLVIDPNGVFSNQADLVVVDCVHNAPLHAAYSSRLWPVEAVYALLEIKTSLGPSDIQDSVEKCRRFKSLKRSFLVQPPISDSLFVIWAYEAPSAETAKRNLLAALADVPRAEQPDMIVVPADIVGIAGQYLEFVRLGQEGSQHRSELVEKHGPNLGLLLPESIEITQYGDHSLLTWYVWFDSWLRRAGARVFDPVLYLPDGAVAGRRV